MTNLGQIVATTKPNRAVSLGCARNHRELAATQVDPMLAASHIAWAEAYEARAGKGPGEAEPGDPCGLLIATGADGQADICPGTLDCYVDVHGTPAGCNCSTSPMPPCGACVDAPLACATCLETVP